MNQGKPELTYSEIDETVLNALDRPTLGYWFLLVFLVFGVVTGLICWVIQMFKGIGVSSQSNSMVWGIYTATYLYWISIAQAGILISGVLYFWKPFWRKPIVRITETMTVLSIMIACLYPFIHLGRVWMLFYVFPISTDHQLLPNFKSPMVFDMMILGTFLMISVMLWILGLLPDLAIVRDRAGGLYKKIFTKLALGWIGRIEQWRDHARAYFLLALFSIPLMISSHVSMAWNFNVIAGSYWRFFVWLLYFFSGSICSGMALILFLTVLVRKVFHFERIIGFVTLGNLAKIIIITGLAAGFTRWIGILSTPGYHTVVFSSMAYHSVAQGQSIGIWLLWILNTLMPLLFLIKKIRRHLAGLVGLSILINMGIWFERSMMMMGRFKSDLFDQAIEMYSLSPVEIGITIGCFSFFLLLFLLFLKHFPTISLTEQKEAIFQGKKNGR